MAGSVRRDALLCENTCPDAEHVMTWILTLFHYTIASLHCLISLRKPLFPIASQNENSKEYSQENKTTFLFSNRLLNM